MVSPNASNNLRPSPSCCYSEATADNAVRAGAIEEADYLPLPILLHESTSDAVYVQGRDASVTAISGNCNVSATAISGNCNVSATAISGNCNVNATTISGNCNASATAISGNCNVSAADISGRHNNSATDISGSRNVSASDISASHSNVSESEDQYRHANDVTTTATATAATMTMIDSKDNVLLEIGAYCRRSCGDKLHHLCGGQEEDKHVGDGVVSPAVEGVGRDVHCITVESVDASVSSSLAMNITTYHVTTTATSTTTTTTSTSATLPTVVGSICDTPICITATDANERRVDVAASTSTTLLDTGLAGCAVTLAGKHEVDHPLSNEGITPPCIPLMQTTDNEETTTIAAVDDGHYQVLYYFLQQYSFV